MPFPFLPLLAGAAALFFVTRKKSPASSVPSSSPSAAAGCEGLTGMLPRPTGSDTGFDALPKTPMEDLGGKSFYDYYYSSMQITPSTFGMSKLTQEPTAIGCEEKAKILRCNGYTKAADLLMQQAAEIRQWNLPGDVY
jgi:hypothetical protein